MKPLIGILFAFCTSGCFAADAYKWVDDKGITNYGEKPPASGSAKPVNTNPGAIIEGGSQYGQKPAYEEGRPAPLPPGAPPVGRPAPGPAAARGMDFDVFIRLQAGMTEGELLLRAGPPDYQGAENAYYDVVNYYYFPTIANPYTTVVKVRSGRIANLERIKKL
jgi:hypothetical protein